MKEPILASIKFDTSELDKKIDELKSLFLEGIPEELTDVITSLLGNIIFVNSSTTRRTLGAVEIIYLLDFDLGTYNEILTTVRTLKTKFTHQ
ncbi:hypothetical protein Xvie_04075 [Xenorhabdus vietnamensis]|uniref:Uncharacterized protein n=1 Tax=Xenorhabdus vietnamensis TaxID=351656 RepID=A0A1Y2S5U0_9GAMM|nr:hypothetical protein [Xenorhabdus vietnamensis]OTA14007.1 hypothetical protein Xvie_04075 [Xenorhabdus vietnamensis]